MLCLSYVSPQDTDLFVSNRQNQWKKMAKIDPQQHTNLDTLLKLLPVVIAALAIYWGFASLLPSADAYTDGDDKQFSQQKALSHLKIISEKPHFLGSQAHGNVRQYLVDEIKEMGLEVNIFEHMATHSRYYYNAGNSKNITCFSI